MMRLKEASCPLLPPVERETRRVERADRQIIRNGGGDAHGGEAAGAAIPRV